MDWSLPDSSVHGILQARILEWVAISFSRGSSQPWDWTQVSCIAGGCFIIWAIREALLSSRTPIMLLLEYVLISYGYLDFYSFLFSFCSSDYIISFYLSSSWLTLSSANSHLLLSSSSEFLFHSLYFQLQNFYLFFSKPLYWHSLFDDTSVSYFSFIL